MPKMKLGHVGGGESLDLRFGTIKPSPTHIGVGLAVQRVVEARGVGVVRSEESVKKSEKGIDGGKRGCSINTSQRETRDLSGRMKDSLLSDFAVPRT